MLINLFKYYFVNSSFGNRQMSKSIYLNICTDSNFSVYMEIVAKAIESMRIGKPVLIYDADGREEETDMTVASQKITPNILRTMRKDCGGLICTTVSNNIASKLGIPYVIDAFDQSKLAIFKNMHTYKDSNSKPSFSITIDLNSTSTGISDIERSATIAEFANISNIARNDGMSMAAKFPKLFKIPGHVQLLISSKGLLNDRQGHTELSIALTELSNLVNTATIVEMLSDDGKALSKRDAMRYAEKNNFVFIEGNDIIERWKYLQNSIN